MKQIAKSISQALTGAAAVATLFAGKVMALGVRDGIEAAKTDDMPTELIGTNGVFNGITNTILYIIGILSVVMLIFGGLKYALSAGDSKKVTDAKNTILYALIGLIISILAYAIVNFVLDVVVG
ncbi:hypothetical protein IJH46_00635 [Candidatus Saccharibacteria bacterium]|nr:hypothetical protein [Candidatus Saccharibacteria bacterium]